MEQQENRLTVLARIPDLNGGGVEGTHATARHSNGFLPPYRILGQSISCKLLAGLTLFLLVGAAIPLSIYKNKPAAPATGIAATGQSPAAASGNANVNSAANAGAVADRKPCNAMPVAPAPAVVLAVPEQTGVPAKAPVAFSMKTDLQGNEPILVSRWSPDDATGGTASVQNIPSVPAVPTGIPSVRPVEYQANKKDGGLQ
jgi:hypothetical protein